MTVVALSIFAEAASACHTCRKNPCVMVAAPVVAPAYQCVTEMVPQTSYRPVKRVEYETVSETIMARVATTTYVERQRLVCKPVYDTQYVQREVISCRPVRETTYVNQQYTVCRPVSTTRQVTEYAMQASTSYVNIAVATPKCGHCGKVKPTCVCQTVAQTTYTPVPVVKDVVVTQMVPETLTRQVPVTTVHMVSETKVVNVPIRSCRMVQEVVTDRIPVTSFHCEAKVVTRRIPHTICETVAVTTYHPVKRMVPIVYAPAPTPVSSPQSGPTAQG